MSHPIWRAVTAGLLFVISATVFAEESPGDSLLPDFYNDPMLSTSGIKLDDYESSSVDYFSGMMSRSATDFSLPGNGGMALTIQRSYNSQQPYTWPEYTAVGVGWTMNFGWVEIANVDKMCNPIWSVSIMDNPVLHMPDGSTDVLAMTDAPMADMSAIHYRGKAGMGIICGSVSSDPMAPFIMMGPDGTRYEFERWSAGGAMAGFYRTAKWFVKRVIDKHGNWISYDYADVGTVDTGRIVAPIRATASDGRDVFLEYDAGLLQRILYGAEPVVEYAYLPAVIAGSFSNLVTVTLREELVWTYEYSAKADPGAGSMTRATNPFGGRTDYTWQQMYFQSGDGRELNSAVVQVVQDPIQSPTSVWMYAYTPAATIGQRDVTTVTAPEGVYEYRHFSALGMVSGEVWKVGLKERVTFTPYSGPVRIEEFTWSPYMISQENNKRTSAAGMYVAVDEAYYGPLLADHVTRIGGKTWRTTQSQWWWSTTFIGTPQAQTVTMEAPGGQQHVVNRRYEHRPELNIYFLLHQEWITQALFPGYTTMQVVFDALGDPINRFDRGFYTHFTYDAQGNLQSETRGLNGDKTQGVASTTQFSDYYRGIAQRTEHPDNTLTLLLVDPYGRTTRKTDRDGKVTSYAYDLLGRVRQIDYPIGNDTFLTYTDRVTTLDRGPYHRTTTIDGFGRNVVENHSDTVRARTIQVTRAYDDQGRAIFTSYPNSVNGNAYQYDDFGRVTRVTHPGGYRTYDYVDGDYVDATDENGKLTRLFRDEIEGPGKGELVRIESPEGIVTTIDRNEYGLPLQVAQGDGTSMVTRTNTYNASLVLLSTVVPEKAPVFFYYDFAGNVTDIMHETTPGYGRIQHNEYDLNGRVISTTAPLNTLTWDSYEEYYSVELTYSYTPEGKPVDQTRSESITRIMGGTTQVYSGGSYSTWHHEYDANGNLRLERLTAPDVDWQFQYTHDANDRLATITYPGNEVVAYQPDAFGWPTQAGTYAAGVTYHETGQLAGFTYGNGRQASIAVNNRYLIDSMVVPGISDLSYGYDSTGNVLSITDARDAAQNVVLRYDGMNRMIGADGAWGVGTFAYDETGNIRQKSLGSDSLSMAYDSRNRLESIVGSRNLQYSYDLFGNIAHRDGQDFGYDGMGNLVFQVGIGISGETRYQYDARGRRLATVKGGERQYSLYANGGNLLYETNPSEGTWRRNVFVGSQMIGYSEKYIACYEDIDGDGIPHCAEQEAGLDPYNPLDASGDLDGDGLSNLAEYQRGTGINDADTDDDGMGDGIEVSYGLDPKIDDAGGDLDGDGLPNVVELARGFNPANPADGVADQDIDGLSNGAEYQLGTNWQIADTDNDGMNDGYEVGNGLNPLVNDASGDADGDGMPNVYEFNKGLNPADATDAALDADSDGLSNGQEYALGTDPRNADTDGDGMTDGYEIANGKNPLVDDSRVDTDGDGLPDVWEIAHGLNPNFMFDAEIDHDNDGESTLSEYRNGRDPFVVESPAAPNAVVAAPGDGKTWVSWHADPLVTGGYSVDWGVVGTTAISSASTSSTGFSTATSNDTLYWYQIHAKRGNVDVVGRRVVSVSGAGADMALPYTQYAGCQRTQIGVVGDGAFFFACEQNGNVQIYRNGPGSQPAPQVFPAGAQQAGQSGWRFVTTLNGNALYAWMDASSNTLMGTFYDAVAQRWQDSMALEDYPFYTAYNTGTCNNIYPSAQYCRYFEIYAFDAYADWQGNLYAYYAVNDGYEPNGYPSYSLRRQAVSDLGLGLNKEVVRKVGQPLTVGAGSLDNVLVAERSSGSIFLTSVPTNPGANTSYSLGYIQDGWPWPTSDRQVVGWSNMRQSLEINGARACGSACQPMQDMLETSNSTAIHAFGGVGDGQLYWHVPGGIRYSKIAKSAQGVYSWGRPAVLASDALLTSPASLRFAHGDNAASFYWSNTSSEIRAMHIKADGTWTTPSLLPVAGRVVDLGADWAGNLVLAIEKDGSYIFRERRRLPSGIDYATDSSPPVLSESSVRSGKSTITQKVTLSADEPANLFFSVTGGTITGGGSNTTAEQRYTGPVTITFPKGSSATITYRGINMAELWSNPVSTVLQ